MTSNPPAVPPPAMEGEVKSSELSEVSSQASGSQPVTSKTTPVESGGKVNESVPTESTVKAAVENSTPQPDGASSVSKGIPSDEKEGRLQQVPMTRDDKQRLRYDERSKQVSLANIQRTEFSMHRDPMESILEESVLLLLETKGIQINKTALNELTYLTTNFANKIFKDLHKLTEVQRRRHIAKADLKLLLKERYFDLAGVLEQYSHSKNNFKKCSSNVQKLDSMASSIIQSFDMEDSEESISEEDPNYVFFNDLSSVIAKIVPPKTVTRAYIPSYLPPFPPEHTYRATENYTENLKDPRKIKERLVEESRLGEKALHHIVTLSEGHKSPNKLEAVTTLAIEQGSVENPDVDITPTGPKSSQNKDETHDYYESRNIKWDDITIEEKVQEASSTSTVNHFEVKDEDDPLLRQLMSMNDVVLIQDEEEKRLEAEKEKKRLEEEKAEKERKLNDHSFDIVEYSKKRTAILERKRKFEETLYQKRITSKDSKLGKHLGFYVKDSHHPEDLSKTISGMFQDQYQNVYLSLKLANEKKQKLIAEQEEARRKAEEENLKNVPADDYNIEFDLDDDNSFDIDMDDVLENGVDLEDDSNVIPVVTEDSKDSIENLNEPNLPEIQTMNDSVESGTVKIEQDAVTTTQNNDYTEGKSPITHENKVSKALGAEGAAEVPANNEIVPEVKAEDVEKVKIEDDGRNDESDDFDFNMDDLEDVE